MRTRLVATLVLVASAALAQSTPTSTPILKVPLRRSPEFKVAPAQLKAAPLVKNDALKAALDRVRAAAPTPPPELARVQTATINDGNPVACNERVRMKLRLAGGTRVAGQHKILLARLADPNNPGGFIPTFEQRSFDVTLNVGEEKDVVVEPEWTVRCTQPVSLLGYELPELFLAAVVTPIGVAATGGEPNLQVASHVVALRPFGKFTYAISEVTTGPH